MVKRKGNPSRVTEEKRQCMTWNMLDGPRPGPSAQGSLSVLPDNDPSLLQEIQESETNNEKVNHGSNRSHEAATKDRLEFSSEDLQEMFCLFLEDCTFHVTLFNKSFIKEGKLNFEVGKFKISLLPRSYTPSLPESLPQCKECWLYVSPSHQNMLYYELDENDENVPSATRQKKKVIFWCVKFDLPIQVLQSLQDTKYFQCVIGCYDNKENRLHITVYGTESSISIPAFPSEACKHRRHCATIQKVVSYFFNLPISAYSSKNYTKKHNIEKLYENIKLYHDSGQIDHGVDVQHPALRPMLRPYQKKGVNWMLEKEKFQSKENGMDKELHMLFLEIQTPDGSTLYFNKYGGSLTRIHQDAVPSPPGGILADEMGLGKTVEVLACMLTHRRTDLIPPVKQPVLKDLEEMIALDYSSAGSESTRGSFPDAKIPDECETNPSTEDKEEIQETDTKSEMACETNIQNCNSAQRSTSETEYCDVQDVSVNPDSTGGTESVTMEALEEKSCDITDDRPTLKVEDSCVPLEETFVISDEICIASTETCVTSTETCATSSKTSVNSSQNCDPLDVTCQEQEMAELRTAESEASDKKSNGDKPTRQRRKRKCFTKSKQRRRSALNTGVSSGDSTVTKKAGEKRKTHRIPSKFVDIIPEDAFQPKNIFCIERVDTPRKFFECICGSDGEKIGIRRKDKKHKIQCIKCGLWQHAECVNYDLNDPYRGEFQCPHCQVSSEPIRSGATLIISPSSICHQWVDEILKHIRKESLKVFVYTGVNKLGFIQPMTLAQQDIVITTYETLRSEINYVDLPHTNSESGRKFRHPKRFMAIPSPITAVEWWRICLDEAQMVECTTTKTAEMALRLKAINKWCVTGTPIQKSIEDLYGLLLFLGVDPFWVQEWWKKLVYEPFCYGIEKPMFDLVSSVLWRTAKKDVLDQINIPEQTEHVHWLTFSPVEDHFYRRQYGNSVQDYMKKLEKWNDTTVKLSSLDRHTLSQLMYPLLRLRQACCHPQAVRGEFVPLHLNRSAMTMEELLESLTKKAKTESEEAHRQLVAAFNGLAGWHIIKEQYSESVDMYREVLRSVEEHKGQLRTDDLQLLHAMYNLHEILNSKPEGVAPTLRDDQLESQVKELKQKYMLKARTVVTNVQHQLHPIQRDILNLKTEFDDGTEWWLEIIENAVTRGAHETLIEAVKGELMKDHVDDPLNQQVTIARSFDSTRGLELVLHQRMTAFESAYDKLLQALNKLYGEPSQDLINETVDCCLRPVGEIKNSCPFCKVHKLFEDYESKLFSFKEQGVMVSVEGESQVSTRRQGTWADSELERVLKSLLSFGKIHYMDRDSIEYGQIHVKLLDTLKKEFKQLRIVWIELKAYVSSLDELAMATTRLRVRLPDEPKPDNTQMNIIEPAELDHHKLKLLTDKTVAQNELRRKLGQLLYLKNLAKAQVENKDGINPEPCPVCQRELGKEWSVLQCGHCYCLDCIRTMCEQYSFGGRNRLLKCAICRQRTYHSDISYVSTVKSELEKKSGVNVKGSHSTKVQGIVKCLKEIKRDDPTAKTLVFSTWTDVLNVIAQALTENDISFRTLYSGGKFQQNLSAFKEEADISALLLPIHSGANGLNLIEATYVLLVEPVLNPAQELQAIGRVHRIGQSRSTQIHRFLIRGTIEQKMYSMLKAIESSPSSHDTEENTLTIEDLTSLFKEEREPDTSQEEGDNIEIDNTRQSDSPSEMESLPDTSTQAAAVNNLNTSTSSAILDTAVASTSGQPAIIDTAVASTSGPVIIDTAVASTSGQPAIIDTAVASTSGQPTIIDTAVASTSGQPTIIDTAVASTSGLSSLKADGQFGICNQTLVVDDTEAGVSSSPVHIDLTSENSPLVELDHIEECEGYQSIEIDTTADQVIDINDPVSGVDFTTTDRNAGKITNSQENDQLGGSMSCPIKIEDVEGRSMYQPIKIEDTDTAYHPIEREDGTNQYTSTQTINNVVIGDGTENQPLEIEDTRDSCLEID